MVLRRHSRLRRLHWLFIAMLLLAGCATPVRVEWKTETEMNTAGFNLYRSTSEEGPFDLKVNETLIPPADDPLTGQDYVFVDRTAEPGITYYYQLEEVERGGALNTFGPISVRAGGLDWRHAAVLIALALVVLFLWIVGGRQAARRRQQPAPGTASVGADEEDL